MGVNDSGPQRVAAIIWAHDDAHDIASTVRSCRAIPAVDLLIVVDDGSTDETGAHARMAGAVVVRHSVPRGRASAMETGVKVAAMRDRADWPPRLLLFLSSDLGESAVEAAVLVEAVMTGMADCACASEKSSRRLPAARIARRAIRRATGWAPESPMSENRCITREALTAIMPFANGYGLEPAMTIDLLMQGFTMVELPCAFVHLGGDRTLGELNKPQQLIDTLVALTECGPRVLTRSPLRRSESRAFKLGDPYPHRADETPGRESDADEEN